MKTLSHYIIKSLKANQKVAIKGLGSFTPKFEPAVWNEATKMFVPPSEKASFTYNPTVGFHSLAIPLATAERCTEDQAIQKIEFELAQLQEALETKGRLKCDLGLFFLDENKKTAFKPSIDQNLSSQYYGLNIFRVPVKEAGKSAPITIERPNMPLVKSKARAWMRAAAVLVPAAGLLFMATQKADWGISQVSTAELFDKWFSSSEPIDENQAAKQDAESQEENLVEDAGLPEISEDEISDEPVETVKTEVKSAIKPAAKPAIEAAATQKPQAGFYIIVGSFKDAENAQSLAAVLETQGFDPMILDDNTAYTKVSLGRHENRTQAESRLKEYKAQLNAGAWIFKGK